MNLYRVELKKMLSKKSVKVVLGVYGLLFMLIVGGYILTEKSVGLDLFSNMQFARTGLSSMMLLVLPLFSLVLGAQSQTLDVSRGTLKNMFLLPVSKTHIFVSKVMSVGTIIGTLLMGQFVIALGLAFWLEGGTVSGIGQAFLEHLGALAILGLVGLMGAVLILLFKNTGLSLIIAYGIYISMKIVAMTFPIFEAISITTVIGNYDQLFALSEWNVLLSTSAYYIIGGVAGWKLFEKKEERLCQFD